MDVVRRRVEETGDGGVDESKSRASKNVRKKANEMY